MPLGVRHPHLEVSLEVGDLADLVVGVQVDVLTVVVAVVGGLRCARSALQWWQRRVTLGRELRAVVIGGRRAGDGQHLLKIALRERGAGTVSSAARERWTAGSCGLSVCGLSVVCRCGQ